MKLNRLLQSHKSMLHTSPDRNLGGKGGRSTGRWRHAFQVIHVPTKHPDDVTNPIDSIEISSQSSVQVHPMLRTDPVGNLAKRDHLLPFSRDDLRPTRLEVVCQANQDCHDRGDRGNRLENG